MGKKEITVALMLILPGCSLTAGSFCFLAKPHRFTDATVNIMSEEEIKQELAYDKTGQELCGWKQ